jgi:hypothetical protein
VEAVGQKSKDTSCTSADLGPMLVHKSPMEWIELRRLEADDDGELRVKGAHKHGSEIPTCFAGDAANLPADWHGL